MSWAADLGKPGWSLIVADTWGFPDGPPREVAALVLHFYAHGAAGIGAHYYREAGSPRWNPKESLQAWADWAGRHHPTGILTWTAWEIAKQAPLLKQWGVEPAWGECAREVVEARLRLPPLPGEPPPPKLAGGDGGAWLGDLPLLPAPAEGDVRLLARVLSVLHWQAWVAGARGPA